MTTATFSTHDLARRILANLDRHSCEVLADLIAPDKASTCHGSEWLHSRFFRQGVRTRVRSYYRGRMVGFELDSVVNRDWDRHTLAQGLLAEPDKVVAIELIDDLL